MQICIYVYMDILCVASSSRYDRTSPTVRSCFLAGLRRQRLLGILLLDSLPGSNMCITQGPNTIIPRAKLSRPRAQLSRAPIES